MHVFTSFLHKLAKHFSSHQQFGMHIHKFPLSNLCAYMNTHFMSTLTTALEILHEYTHILTLETLYECSLQYKSVCNTLNMTAHIQVILH